jgi:LmbE family N-acetylglucosaminyl deacetylase
MGYGDGVLTRIYYARSESEIIPSYTETKTYGAAGKVLDFHSQIYGEAGIYNRKTFCSDMEEIISIYKPERIFTTSYYDGHRDHSILYKFVVDAIINVKSKMNDYLPELFESIIWAPGGNDKWPLRDEEPSPLSMFTEPPGLSGTPLIWSKVERFVVPAEMQLTPRVNNLKYRVIQSYTTQRNPILNAFVKIDEFFWKSDLSRIRD